MITVDSKPSKFARARAVALLLLRIRRAIPTGLLSPPAFLPSLNSLLESSTQMDMSASYPSTTQVPSADANCEDSRNGQESLPLKKKALTKEGSFEPTSNDSEDDQDGIIYLRGLRFAMVACL